MKELWEPCVELSKEFKVVVVLDHHSSENDDSTLCTERKKEGDAKAFHNPFLLL